jgi:hypothetical protein
MLFYTFHLLTDFFRVKTFGGEFFNLTFFFLLQKQEKKILWGFPQPFTFLPAIAFLRFLHFFLFLPCCNCPFLSRCVHSHGPCKSSLACSYGCRSAAAVLAAVALDGCWD